MITTEDIEITLTCEPEDIQIRGNASAIDEETDAATERWILRQLEGGNEWAWCYVRVKATWYGLSVEDTLGCCSYASEEDFRAPGGYFDDMVNECVRQLNECVEKMSGSAVGLARSVVR